MTPSHTPGGALYVTVIQGQISTRSAGAEETFQPGGTIALNNGDYVEMGNATSGSARVIATAILPMRAPLTIDPAGFSNDAYSGSTQGSGVLDSVVHTPRPTTVYHSAIAVERPTGVFAVAHVLLDLEPGVWTPQHIHGGQELVVVTSGEMTLQRHGESQMFATGESCVNPSGVVPALLAWLSPAYGASCSPSPWIREHLADAQRRALVIGNDSEPSSRTLGPDLHRKRRAAPSDGADRRNCRQAECGPCGFGNQVGRVLSWHGRDQARLGQRKRESMARIGKAGRATRTRMSERDQRRTHGRPFAAQHVAQGLVHGQADDGVRLTGLQRCRLAQPLLG
jgi:quercetin dioxygenase-like cupin family protein